MPARGFKRFLEAMDQVRFYKLGLVRCWPCGCSYRPLDNRLFSYDDAKDDNLSERRLSSHKFWGLLLHSGLFRLESRPLAGNNLWQGKKDRDNKTAGRIWIY
jgi:hypothetical protein